MKELLEDIRRFVKERDWEQYHSPKNLSMALMVEAAELAEHFQWLTEEQSKNLPAEKRAEIAEEIADVLVYLVNLSDHLGIDPLEAAAKKMAKNRAKYPADQVRGKSHKYTHYRQGEQA